MSITEKQAEEILNVLKEVQQTLQQLVPAPMFPEPEDTRKRWEKGTIKGKEVNAVRSKELHQLIRRAERYVLFDKKDKKIGPLGGRPYYFVPADEDDYFRAGYLVTPQWIINEEKRTVVVLMWWESPEGPKIVAKGFSRCHPDDQFHPMIGRAIALGRALKEPTRRFYNRKNILKSAWDN